MQSCHPGTPIYHFYNLDPYIFFGSRFSISCSILSLLCLYEQLVNASLLEANVQSIPIACSVG